MGWLPQKQPGLADFAIVGCRVVSGKVSDEGALALHRDHSSVVKLVAMSGENGLGLLHNLWK